MAAIVKALHGLRRECFAGGLLDLEIPLPESVDAKTAGAGAEEKSYSAMARAATVTSTSLSTGRINEAKSTVARRSKLRKVLIWSAILVGLSAIAIIALNRLPSMLRPSAHGSALEIVHLTSDGSVMDAAISPDARLLAYVKVFQGKYSLRVKNLQSGEDWELLPFDRAVVRGMRFRS